jgi:hypothetical protein
MPLLPSGSGSVLVSAEKLRFETRGERSDFANRSAASLLLSTGAVMVFRHEFCTICLSISRARLPGCLFQRVRVFMLPRSVICEDCGQIATVRGYGRIEYDWPETTTRGPKPTIPTITSVRLTIDCPCCGVKSQEFLPDEPPPATQSSTPSAPSRDATGRRRDVRLRRIAPAKRRRFGKP